MRRMALLLMVSAPLCAAEDAAYPLGMGPLFTRTEGDPKREAYPLLTDAGEARTRRGEFVLEWLDGEKPVTDYRRKFDAATGIAEVKFQRDGAGFTWTSFVSKSEGVLVVHLRTNKPGSLNFRVSLKAGDRAATVEERRMLVAEDGGFAARVWVYPMESEVTPGEHEITVRGEGEALVLLSPSAEAEKLKPLLGEGHPDTFALWTSLWRRQQAAE